MLPEPLIDWTDVSVMKKFRESLLKQYLRPDLKVRIGIALMDVVAKATLEIPPRRVSFQEVYTVAGFTEWDAARSSVGGLTKVIKRAFGLTTQQAQENKPYAPNWGDLGEAHYSMRPEVAQAWLDSAK